LEAARPKKLLISHKMFNYNNLTTKNEEREGKPGKEALAGLIRLDWVIIGKGLRLYNRLNHNNLTMIRRRRGCGGIKGH
jgi:hypothetical protein